tara:strand:+ start:922 stop:1050 length:129 start_codon:yes stop_codon:yes gene_type:complete
MLSKIVLHDRAFSIGIDECKKTISKECWLVAISKVRSFKKGY